MAHFFVKLIAPRPTFAMDMNEAERKLMQEHALYWKRRQERGEVLVFGPVMDPKAPFGMGILTVADEAAGRAFASSDPAMQANAGFAYEIYPMNAVTRDNATS